jgi:hypothetical protein
MDEDTRGMIAMFTFILVIIVISCIWVNAA